MKRAAAKRMIPPGEAAEESYDDEVIDPEEPENMDWESTTERQPEFFERLQRRLRRSSRKRAKVNQSKE